MIVSKQKNLRLAIDNDVAASMRTTFEARGMTDTEGFRRLFTWLLSQDEIVKAAVLGSIPAEAVDLLEDRILAGLKAANSDGVEVVERGSRPSADAPPEPARPPATRDTPTKRRPAKRGL